MLLILFDSNLYCFVNGLFLSILTLVDAHGGLAIVRAYPGEGAELTKLNPPIVFRFHGVMKDLCYTGCSLNFLFVEITKLLKQLDTALLSMYLLVYIFS